MRAAPPGAWSVAGAAFTGAAVAAARPAAVGRVRGRLAGRLRAALDVTEEEPIPDDSPLLELDNVVIVPHIGSASRQTRNKMARMAAANLIAGITGEPLPNCVNPEAAS